MGHEVPTEDPTEYGNDCGCFDPGKTPKIVVATFSLVALCPGRSWPYGINLNTAWELTQKPTNPCIWEYLDVPWQIIWWASLEAHTKSHLIGYGRISPTARAYYFNSNNVADACRVNFDNALVLGSCDANHRGYDGTGKILV